MARAIGDTIYAFVEGKPCNIALDDVETVHVDRIRLEFSVEGSKKVLKRALEISIEVTKKLGPYITPVIFVLIIWSMEK